MTPPPNVEQNSGALFGRLLGDFGFVLVAGAIELAYGADVYFADRDINGDRFLPDSDFFRIGAMA